MPIIRLAHIYNPPQNKTGQQFVDAGYELIMSSFNHSGLNAIRDAGYTGQFAFMSGKYRIADPATALFPQGQANALQSGDPLAYPPEDGTANYDHSNIAFDGEVVDLRNESKEDNFIMNPDETLVLRNSKSAMGYPMSSSIRALYALYAERVTEDERPDINWAAHFHDDENVNQFIVYTQGALANNRYTPNGNEQYFLDTLDWAVYRREITESNLLEYITNVQGSNLDQFYELVDALCDDAFDRVTIMNEFAFTGGSNAREWEGYTIFLRYRDITDYVTSKTNGRILNVFHTLPDSELFYSLLAAHLISVQDFDKALIKPGEDYSNATEPALLAEVALLGDPLELGAPVAEGSHVWQRRFANGTVTLDGDTGQATISYGEVIIDPEEGDEELPTLEEITEDVYLLVPTEVATHLALLDAFIEAHKEEIVAGLEVVYKPEIYSALWLLAIPELITALVNAGYGAWRVDADLDQYYNINIHA